MTAGGYNRNEQAALFEKIGQLSFAVDEIRLFLDTHPGDAEALALFGEYAQRRSEAIDEYTNTYGPIDAYYVNTTNGWTWIDEPMPWRTEGN
ncbi:MAG: spore coat protein CotJB [Clostridia bacterium]|nr:spore coat protein CotJB [Clostridia bacterium]MBO4428716.1 spore coat protein CotJB [Clostridia bacterium]